MLRTNFINKDVNKLNCKKSIRTSCFEIKKSRPTQLNECEHQRKEKLPKWWLNKKTFWSLLQLKLWFVFLTSSTNCGASGGKYGPNNDQTIPTFFKEVTFLTRILLIRLNSMKKKRLIRIRLRKVNGLLRQDSNWYHSKKFARLEFV